MTDDILKVVGLKFKVTENIFQNDTFPVDAC